MENKDQPKENTPMPANPKPTDEVQMNIETVTPATENKDANVRKNDDTDKKEDKTDKVASKEVESESDAKEVTDNPKEGGKVPTDNPVHKKDETGNPSDEVETVSP